MIGEYYIVNALLLRLLSICLSIRLKYTVHKQMTFSLHCHLVGHRSGSVAKKAAQKYSQPFFILELL